MSYADEVFKRNARSILEHGTSTKGQAVRPHWPDGTPAYTVKQIGVADTYDVGKEFPAITIRKTGLKSAWDEILWIYQKKSNNVHDLRSHIWDSWADEDGRIGKAYGFQMGKKYKYPEATEEGIRKAFPNADCYATKCPNAVGGQYLNWYLDIGDRRLFVAIQDHDGVYTMDQMDKVLYDLKNTPFSRRIMTSMWNPEDQYAMALAPCAYSMTYSVTDEGRKDKKLTLNAVLNQRSNDLLAANNWNTAQYALLLKAVAQVSDMVCGKLLHVIADQHIYDRHIPIVKELLEREEYKAPYVYLDPEIRNFYEFTYDSLHVEDYKAGEQVKFEVAI